MGLRKIVFFILSFLVFISLLKPAYASETVGSEASETTLVADTIGEMRSPRIEQVYVDMPDIFVYGTGFDKDEAVSGQAFLDQDSLVADTGYPALWSELEEGINWYILLDISGSIPDSYFSSIKEGIQNLQDSIGTNDKLVLCTFGSSVNLVADGSQDSSGMEDILRDVQNNDNETLLFEALGQVADLSMTDRTDQRKRCIIAVITDGEDIATGMTQAQEALDKLTDCGTPAYAFCIRDTDTAYINSFSEFARSTGGTSRVFTADEGDSILTDLYDVQADYTCLHFTGENNLVSNTRETFSLHLANGQVLNRDVMTNRWQEDTEGPQLVSAEATDPTHIELIFSEALDGAENTSNYSLAKDGEKYTISQASVQNAEGLATVTLTVEEPLSPGEFSLSLNNVTDVSMEKNPVESNLGEQSHGGASSLSFSLDNISRLEEKSGIADSVAGLNEAERGFDYSGILFFIFVALIAIAIALRVLISKRRKDSQKSSDMAGRAGSAPGIAGNSSGIYGNISETPGKDVGDRSSINTGSMAPKQMKQHIRVDGETIDIDVDITASGLESAHTVWKLNKSLIVGRSSICDIYIDDERMSRQHFALEAENGEVFISDLHSTNGTSVNGIRINQKRRLDPGSIIEAGNMKFVLKW